MGKKLQRRGADVYATRKRKMQARKFNAPVLGVVETQQEKNREIIAKLESLLSK